MNNKSTIIEMNSIAKSRGGKCLSNIYLDNKKLLLWECKIKHKWKANANHIKRGQWCPTCSEGVSERICRKFFEEIFHDKYPKKRYDWLISPKGEKLELDGYNEKLKIAFEYQGRQHYDFKGVNRNRKILEYIQQCDQIKRDTCKQKGITLIEVPYIVKYEDMEKFILEQTKSNIPFQNFNYKDWDIYSPDKLEELNIFVSSKGGICLSDKYIHSQSHLKWKCKEGHEWMATPNNIKHNYWCPYCSRNRKHTIEEIKQIAISKGGSCLSLSYVDSFSKLKFKCKDKHIWDAFPSNIIRGHWCKKCGMKDNHNWKGNKIKV